MMLANMKVDTKTLEGTLVVYIGGYLNSALGERGS